VIKDRPLDTLSVTDTFSVQTIVPGQDGELDEGDSQYVYMYSLTDVLPQELCMEDVASLVRTVTAKRHWTQPSSDATDHDEAVVYRLWTYLRAWLRILLENR
jgi:hypothetical protein